METKRKRNGAYGFLSGAALALAAAFFACAFLSSLLFTTRIEIDFAGKNDERVLIGRLSPASALLACALTAACCGAAALFCRGAESGERLRKAYRILKAFAAASALLGGIAWILAAKAYPTHDSLSCLRHAEALVSGDREYLRASSYLRAFPFQSGLVLWDAAFVAVFGGAAVPALQIANAALLAGIRLLLLGCAERLFGDGRVRVLTAVLVILYAQPVFLCTFVYGVFPGLFFALAAFRAALSPVPGGRGGRLARAALIGLGMAAACALRQNYLIFALALAIAEGLEALRTRSFRPLPAAGCAILFPLLLRAVPQAALGSAAGCAFGPGTPQGAWLVTGFRESSLCSGWFNSYTTEVLMRHGYDQVATKAAIAEDLAERASVFLARPRYAAGFFGRKFVSQWTEPTFQSVWSAAVQTRTGPVSAAVESLFYGNGAEVFARVSAPVVRFVYAAFAVACVRLLRRGNGRPDRAGPGRLPASEGCGALILTLPLACLGTGIYHMFFEAKAQYVLPVLLYMLPYAAAAFAGWAGAPERSGEGASSCNAARDMSK